MKVELKDWLNSINFNKNNLIEDCESTIKDYPAYIVNRCLSGHIDSILFANAMNMNPHIDRDMQYIFYLNSLRKRKRFSPWIKKDKIQDLDAVKSYYGYSTEKAQQALRILNKEQLDCIKQKLDVGGKK